VVQVANVVVLAAVVVLAQVRADRAEFSCSFKSDDAGLCARVIFLADAFSIAAGYQYPGNGRVRLRHPWQIRSPISFPEHRAAVRGPQY
jgi:hypothetical protein